MPNREKVIKGLEEFKADLKQFAGNKADWQKVDDALELLKAMAPIAPAKKSFVICGVDDYGRTPMMDVCGACGEWLKPAAGGPIYCPRCGRKVKWDR